MRAHLVPGKLGAAAPIAGTALLNRQSWLCAIQRLNPALFVYTKNDCLKSDPVTADSSTMFLSAVDDVKGKVRGLKIVDVDCVTKPVHREEVWPGSAFICKSEKTISRLPASIRPSLKSCATQKASSQL